MADMNDQAPEMSATGRVLSAETLQDGPWFAGVKKAYAWRGAGLPHAVFVCIGATVAAALYLCGRIFDIAWMRHAAIIGAVLVALLAVLQVLSPRTGGKIRTGLAVFAKWVGLAVAWGLLVPGFLIFGTLSRVFTRVIGDDPLGRRIAKNRSYWHETGSEAKRQRHTSSMFCVERQRGGRRWIAGLLLLGVIGFAAGEVILRVWFGAHNPLLYTGDADCGYRLQPNQKLATARGAVSINNYSMRYPRDITPEKPAGVFRIFMIGDSTLFAGEYVTDEQTYALRVERHLNEKFGTNGRRIEVLPMGINGWGPYHALGYVKRFGTFNADLAIIAMSAANCDRPLTLLDGTRYPVVKPRLAWEAVFSKYFWEWNRKIATGGTGDYVPDIPESYRHAEKGEDVFVELAATMLKTSPEVMQQAIPQMTYGMNALAGTIETLPNGAACALPYIEHLTPRLAALGVTMDYPAKLFVGKGTQSELFHDNAHLEKKGHVIFAEYLADRIARVSQQFRRYAGLTNPASGAVSAQ
jgi:hypothetical protein